MRANDDGIGTYDPIPKPAVDGEGRPWKDIKLDSARAKYWLGVGAQPSDSAWRLLSMVCLAPIAISQSPTPSYERLEMFWRWLVWAVCGEGYILGIDQELTIEKAGLLEPKFRPKGTPLQHSPISNKKEKKDEKEDIQKEAL